MWQCVVGSCTCTRYFHRTFLHGRTTGSVLVVASYTLATAKLEDVVHYSVIYVLPGMYR
jgi:hypothetical protein